MMWADAVPNLLIGLREGLEAGLVVSILLAALRKAAPEGRRISSAPLWLGVLGAVMLAGSFAAVLTYSTDVLSSRVQEAAAGLLSVLAVGLVTAMVFWMRRTAAGLSAQLRGEVQRAVPVGRGARVGIDGRSAGRGRPWPGGRGGAVLAAVPAGGAAERRRVLQPDRGGADRDRRGRPVGRPRRPAGRRPAARAALGPVRPDHAR